MKGTVHVNNPKAARDAAKTLIGDWEKEHCVGLYLNTKLKLTKAEIISIGSLNANIVHPREVFKPAIVNSDASVIVVHNHPSGDVTPSSDDKEFAKRLKEAGEILAIKIEDFLIITKDDEYYSFKENGRV